MDLLTQYEIPYFHPLAVHFPVVLLLLAMLAALVYLARGTALWRQAAMVFLLLGAGGAYWAGETGETLEEASRGEPIVEAVVETHEKTAKWTLWAALGAFGIFAAAALWLRRLPEPTAVGQRDPVLLRAALALAATAPAVLVAYTSHLGGIMVWGRVVG